MSILNFAAGRSVIDNLIDKVQRHEEVERVEKWRERMDGSDSALRKWVLQPAAGEPVLRPEGSVHRQLRREQAEKWSKLWRPDVLPKVDDMEEWLRIGLPDGPYSGAEDAWKVNGAQLQSAAKRAKDTGAGMDDWTGAHWARLPREFFDRLSLVWDGLCAKAGRSGKTTLPEVWNYIKVACISKPGSSDLRPISVTCIPWRLCVSVVVKNLHAWIATWIDEDLHGGTKAKSIDTAIYHLVSELQGRQDSHTLSGGSIDIAKFFDSLGIDQMLELGRAFWLPPENTKIVRCFYDDRRFFFTVDGCTHPSPMVAENGVLQGCSLSVLFALLIMTLWRRVIRAKHPTVSATVFIDDRNCWVRAPPTAAASFG